MMVNLQATGLRDAIEYDTTDYREDQSALAMRLHMVLEEMQVGLMCKETVVDSWEAIRTVRMGADRIKEATADKLRRDFNDLQFKAGECVEDFSLHATTIANQLQSVSDKITDKEVIKKILHSVPDYLNVAVVVGAAAGDHPMIQMKNRRAVPISLMCTRPLANLATGPRSANPSRRSQPKPT
jgi:hypothetical protein